MAHCGAADNLAGYRPAACRNLLEKSMDANMNAILARWGFPVNESGQPKAVDSAPTPQPKDNEETRKLAQKILTTMSDVKL